MDYKIKIMELKEFNDLVDRTIEGIKKGTIVSNPLKKEFTEVGDVIVSETITEIGEFNNLENVAIEDTHKITLTLDNIKELADFPLNEQTVILYKPGTKEVKSIYVTAAAAGRAEGIHQSTARGRCKSNYKDPVGVIWCYFSEDLISKSKQNTLEL
jgi:hypothetical protein